jgi:hypothetical protein
LHGRTCRNGGLIEPPNTPSPCKFLLYTSSLCPEKFHFAQITRQPRRAAEPAKFPTFLPYEIRQCYRIFFYVGMKAGQSATQPQDEVQAWVCGSRSVPSDSRNMCVIRQGQPDSSKMAASCGSKDWRRNLRLVSLIVRVNADNNDGEVSGGRVRDMGQLMAIVLQSETARSILCWLLATHSMETHSPSRGCHATTIRRARL